MSHQTAFWILAGPLIVGMYGLVGGLVWWIIKYLRER
jgi:hypothetical protein